MLLQELYSINKNVSEVTELIIKKTLAKEEKDRFSWDEIFELK